MTTNDTPEPEAPASGPSTAGPSTAGPSTAGPSTAGPSTAGPTSTGPDAGPSPRPVDPSFGAGFFDSVRRTGIARSNDRWIGGVAAGVAERYGLDPLLVRGLLILSVFVAGIGLVLYGIAWLLLPERSDGRIHLQETFRGTFDVAVLGAGLLILFGLVSHSGIWPWWRGPAEWVAVLLWIAFWVAVVWLVVKLVRSRRGSDRDESDGTWTTTGPGTSGGTASPAAGSSADVSGGFSPAPRAHYAPAAEPAAWSTSTSGTTTGTTTGGTPGTTSATAGPGASARAPLAPPKPPPPPRRPSASAGFTTVGVVVGLSLLVGAGLLATDLSVGLTLPVWSLWLALSTLIVGAAIVVSGLRGRRGGWLSFLAVLALVATVVTWPFADGRAWSWEEWGDDATEQITTMSGTTLSSGTVTPRSVDSAEQGVRVRFGDATVDLTELDLSQVTPGDPVVVPIDVTAGRTVVEIPDGTAVQASVDVNAAGFAWDVDGQHLTVNGFSGGPATYQTDEVRDRGGAVLLLEVDARAGDLVIEER
ncbi:PspC domain-containing protein [Isoptericola jiangsuensis]|uniref:PspC domain-containing protein n=1 Tax=Isoptericola jiangsuensis TaxID=548579 RepID=UPI003AAD9A61